MTASILNGTDLAQKLKNDIKKKIQGREQPPHLAVILASNDPASRSYVAAKEKACQDVGFHLKIYDIHKTVTQQSLETLVLQLNNEKKINGILVQLPLPQHINKAKILELIVPEKDVDGFHPYNLGRLCQRLPTFRPCTPKGIMMLLMETKQNLLGMDAIVIGASEIVGRPMTLELLLAGCTVTIAHKFTHHLDQKVQKADLVIAATGKPHLVQGSWIKPGAIVIDVGITRMQNGEIYGDVDFAAAKEKASWITPVPGGVGPMTVASLLSNTLQAADLQQTTAL